MACVLVMDTCGDAGYVAVVDFASQNADASSERWLGVRATQEELLPAVEAVLGETSLALRELSAIAVVDGPGSFTGVRIGLATAKGLCEAAELPLVVLSRLAVLAEAAGRAPVWAWLQAGRVDVYAAWFSEHIAGAGRNVAEQEAVLSMDAARGAAGDATVAVCEEPLRDAAPCARYVPAEGLASALRKAAVRAVQEQCWADVALADARYLRVPDAELALRARQG